MSLESFCNYFGNTVKSEENDEEIVFFGFSQSNNPTNFETNDLFSHLSVNSNSGSYDLFFFHDNCKVLR